MIQIDEHDVDRITAVLHAILKGKKAEPIELPKDYPDNEIAQLTGYVNKFLMEYNEITAFAYRLGQGETHTEPPKGKIVIGQSLKNLQASLKNLTWTTQRIAAGDFSQRVSFMGEFSEAFNSMAVQLQTAFQEQARLTGDLQQQVAEADRTRRAMLNILEDLQDAKRATQPSTRGRTDSQPAQNL